MPAPRLRSRSLKRKKVRTPGGRLVTHYWRRTVRKYRCAVCGGVLHGCPTSKEDEKLAKTKKRPERPYGGYLCHRCLRAMIKAKVREGV
ncbi:MAG: 50S ribosomal protein L34e [Candidatus Freyarchaeota archaeon]|nr:50S ribosomal protein L34e [Candidatus Freyrarchaeum guaymaensis]